MDDNDTKPKPREVVLNSKPWSVVTKASNCSCTSGRARGPSSFATPFDASSRLDGRPECQRLVDRRTRLRAHARKLFDRDFLAQLKEGEDLIARDVGVNREKGINAFSSLQEIDQRLHRDSRSCEAGRSV